MGRRYVLITAAYNEAAYIEYPIWSVIVQTVQPERWIIVSDGSSDGTDDIIWKYASRHDFIVYRRLEKDPGVSGFASKVRALNEARDMLKDLDYDFVGHLDADVSFHADYYERLMAEFHNDLKLGLSGGYIQEKKRGQFKSRPTNRRNSVPGAIQFFRRQCYEDIGKFIPLEMGGEDWHAEVSARMKGWHVASVPSLAVFHHKVGPGVRGHFRDPIRSGCMDYRLGSHPLFEILKCLRRVKEKPYVIGAALRLGAFFWSQGRRKTRPVSVEFIRHLRREQAARLPVKIPWADQNRRPEKMAGQNNGKVMEG